MAAAVMPAPKISITDTEQIHTIFHTLPNRFFIYTSPFFIYLQGIVFLIPV